MPDFDRLKKNIYIINIHLHKRDEAKANMIQNFIQNNHGVSTVNHVTHGHINAGKNDVLGAEPFIDSYTEPAAEPFTKATKEEHEAYIKINFDPITRSMLEDFPDLPYKKQLKVLTYMEIKAYQSLSIGISQIFILGICLFSYSVNRSFGNA